MNLADQIIEHGPYQAGDLIPFLNLAAEDINGLRDELIASRLAAAEGYRAAIETLRDVARRTGSPAAKWAADYIETDLDRRGPLLRAGSRGVSVEASPVDSCTCPLPLAADPYCPVHNGRRARGPKPPPVGPGCVCDGSGRTCPRHGAVI